MSLAAPHGDDSDEAQRIADSTQSPSTGNHDAIVFGRDPVEMKCPFCLQRMRTEIIMKLEVVSIMLGLALFTVFTNAIMIVVIVGLLHLTATRKHRCSVCQRELGSDGKFLMLFTDQIYSFALGETGILLSKKILVTVGLFFTAVGIVYLRSQIESQHQWAAVSWVQFKQKCRYDMISPACQSEYQGKTVADWKGYVMRVEDRRHSMRRFYNNAIEIYLKMDPPERDDLTPDLYLTGSSSTLFDIYGTLDQLRHGDEIMFNATFVEVQNLHAGDSNRNLEIVNITRTGRSNPNVEIYLSPQQEQQYEANVQGKALRQQK